MAYNKYSSASTLGSTAKDVAFPTDATDTITALSWSPTANHLASASWDGKVRIYDVAASGQASGIAMISADGPVFSCDFSQDGTLVAAVGVDKKVHLLQAASNQSMAFANAHDAPIRAVRFVEVPSAAATIIATGSWDKTIRYWDMRQTSGPVSTLTLDERIYAMDTSAGLLVAVTASGQMHQIDLRGDPSRVAHASASPIKHQIRTVSCSPDGKAFCVGSIEGRVSYNTTVDNKDGRATDTRSNFTFRCHRDAADTKNQVKVWTVNDLSWHPTAPSVVATGGSDGTFVFWNVADHSRLQGFPSAGGAVTATAFSRHDGGRLFAYAVGYDWAQGYASNSPAYPLKLMLHAVQEGEINKRARK